MTQQPLTPTASQIISLFNHYLSSEDIMAIKETFKKVESGIYNDDLAKGVL